MKYETYDDVFFWLCTLFASHAIALSNLSQFDETCLNCRSLLCLQQEGTQQIDSSLLIKSLLMIKEATKCRQYEPEEDIGMLGFLLRDTNEALDSL